MDKQQRGNFNISYAFYESKDKGMELNHTQNFKVKNHKFLFHLEAKLFTKGLITLVTRL